MNNKNNRGDSQDNQKAERCPNDSGPLPAPNWVNEERTDQEHLHIAGKIPSLLERHFRICPPVSYWFHIVVDVQQVGPPGLS